MHVLALSTKKNSDQISKCYDASIQVYLDVHIFDTLGVPLGNPLARIIYPFSLLYCFTIAYFAVVLNISYHTIWLNTLFFWGSTPIDLFIIYAALVSIILLSQNGRLHC